jgi:hypothetical protein
MNQPEATDRNDTWRAQMLADLNSGNTEKATDALLSLTLNDPDRVWVERLLLQQLDPGRDVQIRSLALTCLGHLARIHGTISKELVVPRLDELARDPLLGGIAEDALADIRRFAVDDG